MALAATSSVRTAATKKAAPWGGPVHCQSGSAIVDGNELAQLVHLRRDFGLVGVELCVPFTQLVDGTVPFCQYREVHRPLGAPDIHVLVEGVAVLLHVLQRQRLVLFIGPAGNLLDQYAETQLELV